MQKMYVYQKRCITSRRRARPNIITYNTRRPSEHFNLGRDRWSHLADKKDTTSRLVYVQRGEVLRCFLFNRAFLFPFCYLKFIRADRQSVCTLRDPNEISTTRQPFLIYEEKYSCFEREGDTKDKKQNLRTKNIVKEQKMKTELKNKKWKQN